MKKSLSLLFTVALIGGCFGGGQNCGKPEAYQAATPTTPVRAPEGLDELDDSRDLKVPVASTPPGAAQGRCLDRPPAYSEQMATVREDD